MTNLVATGTSSTVIIAQRNHRASSSIASGDASSKWLAVPFIIHRLFLLFLSEVLGGQRAANEIKARVKAPRHLYQNLLLVLEVQVIGPLVLEVQVIGPPVSTQ